MNWLDRYHDDWRTADYPLDIGIDDTGTYIDLLQEGFVERSPMCTVDKTTSTPITPKVSLLLLLNDFSDFYKIFNSNFIFFFLDNSRKTSEK